MSSGWGVSVGVGVVCRVGFAGLVGGVVVFGAFVSGPIAMMSGSAHRRVIHFTAARPDADVLRAGLPLTSRDGIRGFSDLSGEAGGGL